MTTMYFNVKGGLQTGNVIIDGASSNVTGVGNASLGNLVTANYFSGNGTLLTGINGANINGQVANALVAGTVYNPVQTAITQVGTLTSLTVTGNISGGNVSGTLLTGTLTTSAQPNITSVGTLSSLSVTGNVSAANLIASSSISAPTIYGNVVGNISGTLAVPGNNKNVLFNDNGAAGADDGFTFDKSNGALTLVGNITTSNANLGNLTQSNYFKGDGSLITNVNASNLTTGTIASGILGNSTVYVGTTGVALNRASGSLALTGITSIDGYASTVSTAAQPNITSVGTLTELNVSGNATIAGNLTVSGTVEYVNVTTLAITDPIIEQGGGANATALSSNDGKDRGSLLHYYNGSAKDAFMGWDNSAGEFGFGSNVTESSGVITWNSYGNVHAASFIGDASALTGQIGNALVAGTVYTNAQPNITSVGTLTDLSVTGNVTAGNFVTSGSGGNISGADYVIANYFQGDGSKLSALNASNLSTGTIPSGVLANSTVYIGTTSVALNRASGSQSLTGITSIDGYASTVSTAAQPNITSVGTLTGLTSTGTINFIGTSNVSLGAVANLHINGGSSGYLLSTDGSGSLSWIAPPSTSAITNGTSNVSIPSSNGNVTISVGGTSNVLVASTSGVDVTGAITATGNVTGSYVIGNGSLISSLNASNLSTGTIPSGVLGNSTVYIGTTSVALNRTSGSQSLTGITSIDGYAATVSTNAQPNITSVGTLTGLTVSNTANVGDINITGGLLSNRSNVTVTTNTVIDEFDPSSYRSAKYVISASGSGGYQSVEAILVHDDVNSYVSIYGSVCSNASVDIVDISSNINGVSGNISLYATASGTSTIVNLVATYLKT